MADSAASIEAQAKEYLAEGEYSIDKVSTVPDVTDSKLTFGNKAVKLDATVLYIDMRGSTKVLEKHHKYTVAKIQKAYLHIVTAIVNNNLGDVRSFNGDGILAFFGGANTIMLNWAVLAAMQITWMLTNQCNTYFDKYHSVDFGIGIDYGELLVTKVGIGRDHNNNDLSWIGMPVNTAVRLGDSANSPFHIRI